MSSKQGEMAELEAMREGICERLHCAPDEATYARAIKELDAVDSRVEALMGMTPQNRVDQAADWGFYFDDLLASSDATNKVA